ncbi:MAG: energy-coupling factor ABC transporter permease [Candidatus Eisenbacteria bacterium]|nr:energy-coupling factor ABC transporter permease [Candidatus Eisenbacteria bacterium]
MHIPDGFLEAKVWVPAWVLAAGAMGLCSRKAGRALGDKKIPVMGVTAAFIFAAQMLNFPIAGGTSGHLLGGAIAATLLGPYAGFMVITVVLTVQCLVFQDGGLTTLGANIMNMAFVGTTCVYPIIRVSSSVMRRRAGVVLGASLAAWVSVVAASFGCSLELALSGRAPIAVVVPAMVGVHSVIGIGEALITGFFVGFLLKTRPDLVMSGTTANR